MAAPTLVRVESNSLTTATIRWSYSGVNAIDVYRSTDGIAYTRITDNVSAVVPGTLLYIDSGLVAGTKYWYKLSDDVGSTFSSVVTVWTQSCLPPAGSNDTFSLPRLESNEVQPDPDTGEVVAVDKFNDLSERIENVLGGRVLNPNDCIFCPEDGAVVINCAGHCRQNIVIADEDINSISLQYCNEGDGNIDFVIPPNVTRRITGFPNGFGDSGDLPFVVSGANGLTMSVPISQTGGKAKPTSSTRTTGTGIGSGGGTGVGSCNCTAPDGLLNIKSCNENNSLNCTSTKKLQLIACGGRPPYTWSNTGNINISKTSGDTTTVTPPTNSGSSVAGTAYKLANKMTESAGGFCENWVAWTEYGCNDQVLLENVAADGVGFFPCGSLVNLASLSCKSPACCNIACIGTPQCPKFGCNPCAVAALVVGGSMCDVRSAPMIAAGCSPCGLNSGATVTVTDSLGVQTTAILRS